VRGKTPIAFILNENKETIMPKKRKLNSKNPKWGKKEDNTSKARRVLCKCSNPAIKVYAIFDTDKV